MNIKVNAIEKHYWLKKYLNKTRPYLLDIINNLKKFDTWKIQLIITIIYISSKDNGEELVTHSKADNTEIMFNDKADKLSLFIY